MFTHLFWRYNKNLHAEFFPARVSYLSVHVYAFWKALFAGSPLWFTATNPWFPLWGLYPSSKRDILKQLPSKYIPETIFLKEEEFNPTTIQSKISSSNIGFPLIIKPDNWLKGLGIQVFHSQSELDQWLDNYVNNNNKRWSWLVQKFIEYPVELWVFYIRTPNEEKWIVTWIVEKEFLKIVWDGWSMFHELVSKHPRAKYHTELLHTQFKDTRSAIIAKWESVTIVEIGTHSKWSTFIDSSHKITPELTTIFDKLSHHIDGFYYGRYDVRIKSIEWLLSWEFKIIEINPTYGEPTRMYDPSYNFLQQQKILLSHRSQMYKVAIQNHANWISYASISEWKKSRKSFKEIT